jgi:hypothetical protein
MKMETAVIGSVMQVMMVGQNVTRVDAHTTGPAVNDWTVFPTGPGTIVLSDYSDYSDYMERNTTEFYFCWTAEGEVYPWSDDPVIASTPGECQPPP